MAAARPEANGATRQRWAILLGLSAVFHAALIGGFAFRMPALSTPAATRAMDVALVPPPFVRPLVLETAKPPPETRVVVLDTPPRYAPRTAETGDAGDAVDLFGPVFGDGMWPRPVLVKSEPCDPRDDLQAREACRRELLIIGMTAESALPGDTTP